VDDPELLEQLERRVDGGEGGVRQRGGDPLEDLLGAGMPVELAERSVDQDALRGHPLPARPEAVLKLLLGHP